MTASPEAAAEKHARMMFATNPGRLYATVWAGGKEWLFERTDDGFRLKATRPQPSYSEGREFPSWDAAR